MLNRSLDQLLFHRTPVSGLSPEKIGLSVGIFFIDDTIVLLDVSILSIENNVCLQGNIRYIILTDARGDYEIGKKKKKFFLNDLYKRLKKLKQLIEISRR